jgi:hypothetical protein
MVLRIVCQGGLGNQLFIWNAAHQLNRMYGKRVEVTYLDDSTPLKVKELYPLLEHCTHNIGISQSRNLARFLDWLDRIISRFPKLRQKYLYRRVFDDYSNPHVELIRTSYIPFFVRGYFQNNHLVNLNNKEVSEEIRAHITKLNPPEISKSCGAIHVRRGDYVKSRNYYGVLTKSYYKAIINQEIDYVLFIEDKSEALEFTEENNINRVVDSQQASAWETLTLMQNAVELHMANSTLSWWAGKLSEGRSKRITMPFPWHNEGHPFQELLISQHFEIQKAEYEKYE